MSIGRNIEYTKEELIWIRQHRKWPRRKAHQKFCQKFNRSDVSHDNYKALCTRKGWNTGRTGSFEKGHTPHNKGKEFPSHPNTAKCQFKKGHEPHNTNHTGHERITKDGYIEISIDQTNPHTGYKRRYVLKHKYLWEKENGKAPKGMCLKCLDGNRQNCDPSNWDLISRGMLPYLNGHRGHNYEKMPDETKPSVLALAKIKHKISNLV